MDNPTVHTALILAGHGSHISPNTAGMVWDLVDGLRAADVDFTANEITAAFWKEMPSFHQVLNTVTATDITVVPIFTANGYFTQTVIPSEMGLTGNITKRDGRIIRYALPLSEHLDFQKLVERSVAYELKKRSLSRDQVAVAVIGHSTRRTPESRKAAEDQAQRVRDANLVAEVVTVFLDDMPEIAEVYRLTRAPIILAVPYFLAAGSHTTIDVPRELGLEAGAAKGIIQGRTVYYLPPVGLLNGHADIIRDLARAAGMPHFKGDRNLPMVGSDRLIDMLRNDGVIPFGQLRLTANEVRVWGDETALEVISSYPVLRARVRENPFRSLATSDDLPRGWYFPVKQISDIPAVVETVYPGAMADWTLEKSGAIEINTLEQTAARQTGMYRPLGSLRGEQQSRIVERICGHCVRHPLWHSRDLGDKLPCPEPCNHWLSAALEELP